MKILVFIKEIPDVGIPIEYDEVSGRIRSEDAAYCLNPPDRAGLETALEIKGACAGSRVTVIHMGPAAGERRIREALAIGCDNGIRIWDDGLEWASAAAKAIIFSRTAEICGFDLIVTGCRSLDTCTGQVGIRMAEMLRLPLVGPAISVEVEPEGRGMVATTTGDRGYKERIRSPLPMVLTTEAHDREETYAPMDRLLDAMEKEIPCWDLATIGIPQDILRRAGMRPIKYLLRRPRPRPRLLPSIDAALPAFERIRRLMEGTLRARGRKLIRKNEEELAEELFNMLREEGWLDHLLRKR